ncbi:MAG: SH3 domain-containing protein [Gemmatimonadaceae bacterium]
MVVERNVNLRRDPSTNQTPIRLLVPTDELELLDSAKTNNYYNVFRAESGDTGWVWANTFVWKPSLPRRPIRS